jgi:hypothetical protein
MFYFKHLFKTLLSNISTNKSIFRIAKFGLKVFFINLKYSIKNFNKVPIKTYGNNPKSFFWKNALIHLRFINYFYERQYILKAPIIKIVAGGFLRDVNANYDTQDLNNEIKMISQKIIGEFKFLNFYSVYNFLETYFQSLNNGLVLFNDYKNMKNLSVLEIGSGVGFNSLIYESFIKKQIYFYDFEEMIDIQKNILQNFSNLKNKINFFSNIDLLKKKIKNDNYFITSYWAFSEFDIEDRSNFSEIIEKSKFSIFLSNSKFEKINNHDYFNNLSKKINKKLLIFPFEKKYQENFTKSHNYYILY